MKIFGMPVLLLFVCFQLGCASLNPGSDPLIVRTEQAETAAQSTFDFVLSIDNSDRGFWKTNAPAFHQFAEWLRTPTPYQNSTVARCVAMQLNVDDLKLAYKAAKNAPNSNALNTAVMVLSTAVNQAAAWKTIAVTPTH